MVPYKNNGKTGRNEPKSDNIRMDSRYAFTEPARGMAGVPSNDIIDFPIAGES